ncbi:MAG: polyprenyl synthetase family protein [Pseudomonadota bacterium]
MRLQQRIDRAITPALQRLAARPAPPKLADALSYAVLPGGARVRPRICLAVAEACGDARPALAEAAAAAIELIHCASLAHDDLPCFDDADLRRGKPALHRAYGEPIAVLTGDALITAAFQILAEAGPKAPPDGAAQAGRLIGLLAEATGTPFGICAGQAWESETEIDLEAYHAAKTGALFVAATRMGACAAGQEPERWTDLGARIGAAFQIADDLRDALLSEEALGKPGGQDAAHARPNAVAAYGLAGAVARFRDTLAAAISSIPSCPGEAALCDLVRRQAESLTPLIAAAAPDLQPAQALKG